MMGEASVTKRVRPRRPRTPPLVVYSMLLATRSAFGGTPKSMPSGSQNPSEKLLNRPSHSPLPTRRTAAAAPSHAADSLRQESVGGFPHPRERHHRNHAIDRKSTRLN